VYVLNRVVLVTLSQNPEKQPSPDDLEKFVREQVESSKISQYYSLEKVTVLEDHKTTIKLAFCSNCRKEIEPSTKFCKNCSISVASVPSKLRKFFNRESSAGANFQN